MIYLLQHCLEESARRSPDNIAVRDGGVCISYRELDELSAKIAVTLSEIGVRRGDRVGIYLPKSIQSVAALQGILKAGGVYVPIDPQSPVARAAYIIENCDIRCLISTGRKLDAVAEQTSAAARLEHVIATDELPEYNTAFDAISWSRVLDADPALLPENRCIETDLAYILYTSGSTGKPKGVMISHLNSLTFVRWAVDTIGVSGEDTLSSHAPFHFDLSVFDLYASFMTGATLVLVPGMLAAFPIRLAEWIERQGITVWYSVPTALSLMVLHGDMQRFGYAKLRTIIYAGEAFPVKYLRELMTLVPNAEYYNWYGPTETNVITSYKVPPLSSGRIQPVPIGRACDNMEVFALSNDGLTVSAPGTVGELYARGSNVAQGYWGDSEKTAGSFLPNTFQPGVQDRVYKTGDMVSLDESGNFIFVSRRDNMIKSRGYRIELGEIETALYDHPDVKEAAVVAVPDKMIGNRIAAFVVLRDHADESAADLQDHCSTMLPKYMVPELLEFITSLPKTSTGKIDRVTLVNWAEQQWDRELRRQNG